MSPITSGLMARSASSIFCSIVEQLHKNTLQSITVPNIISFEFGQTGHKLTKFNYNHKVPFPLTDPCGIFSSCCCGVMYVGKGEAPPTPGEEEAANDQPCRIIQIFCNKHSPFRISSGNSIWIIKECIYKIFPGCCCCWSWCRCRSINEREEMEVGTCPLAKSYSHSGVVIPRINS